MSCRGIKTSQLSEIFIWQVAPKTAFFFPRTGPMYDRNISLTKRVQFFDAMFTAAACLRSGRGEAFQADIRQYDVAFRRFLRPIEGPRSKFQCICLGTEHCIFDISGSSACPPIGVWPCMLQTSHLGIPILTGTDVPQVCTRASGWGRHNDRSVQRSHTPTQLVLRGDDDLV